MNNETPHPQSEVMFKYYLPEHKDDVWIHVNASKMYCLLNELDQLCRSILKHEQNPDEGRQRLAENIREIIQQEIDLDMVS
jgi:hypothetical protein